MENSEVSDEFVKAQLEYLKYYESKRNSNTDQDYLLALKLMEEEEAQAEKDRKTRQAAEDESFAKWLMDQDSSNKNNNNNSNNNNNIHNSFQKPLPQLYGFPQTKNSPPPVLSDAEFAAQLAAKEQEEFLKRTSPKSPSKNTVFSDAEFAAELVAKERQAMLTNNQHHTQADAQIAKLLHEKQELEERLRQAENMPKEAVIDVSAVDFPTHWEPQSSTFQSFDVIQGTEEWNTIIYRFNQTLPSNTISRIERVQNKNLWLWFYLKKKELDAKNSSSSGANEKYAFHGSRANAYDIILKDGFDHRVASMGGAYGAGIYFAHQASTSNGYVAPPTFFGKRKMLYCRILVGDIGPGKHGLRRPPEKNNFFGKTVLFDSVGTDGNVYVLFDNHQCYPEYVIHFN